MSDAERDGSAPDPEEERRRRQAPRWGEYATPEEVAELRGPDAEPIGQAPAPLAPPTGAPLPGPAPAGATRRPNADLIATMALLGIGAWSVVSNVVGFLDMKSVMQEFGRILGDSDIDVPASAQAWGYGLIVLNVALYVGAFAWSRRRLRQGRIAFWVPLVAGIVATLASAIVLDAVLAASGGLSLLQNQG